MTMSGSGKGTGAARTARRSKEKGQAYSDTMHPAGATSSSAHDEASKQAPKIKGHTKRSNMSDSRQNDHTDSAQPTKRRKKRSRSAYQSDDEKTNQSLANTISKRSTRRATRLAVQAQQNSPFRFLDLAPEIRNRIYHFALGGRAIHIGAHQIPRDNYSSPDDSCDQASGYDAEKSDGSKEWVSVMRSRMCNSPHDDFQPLATLTGPAHGHAPADIDDGDTEGNARWYPCDVRVVDPDGPTTTCNTKVDLPLGLLLACRLVNTEAALVPFAENCFIFDDEDTGIHTHSFLRSLSTRERGAIQFAAVFNAQSSTLRHIPRLLPGLTHLWISYCDVKKLDEWGSSTKAVVKWKYSVTMDFMSLAKSLRLVGVAVDLDGDRSCLLPYLFGNNRAEGDKFAELMERLALGPKWWYSGDEEEDLEHGCSVVGDPIV